MNKVKLILIFVGLFKILNFASNNSKLLNPQAFNNQLNSGGIAFTENKGQVHDQNFHPRHDVLYGTMAGNMAVHIKKSGVSYQLNRVDKFKDVEDIRTKETRKEIEQQTIYRIDLNWLNANTNFTTSHDEEFPDYNNYYLESCPNGALNVKSYTGITLHNLYNGINLHYYEKAGNLKYDYIVEPHANYKQIQIKVEGAGIILNKNGSLTLTTPLGEINEGEPLVYQNGKQLSAKWVIKIDSRGSKIISFDVEDYNPNIELIIDPFVTRLWGTYYGGSGLLDSFESATDASGNVYLAACSSVNSSTIIATSGSHQSINGGGYDAYLVKFNNAGARIWGTYYGGFSNEASYALCTDPLGNIYLGGGTSSSGSLVIATVGAHQTTIGGSNDGFLVKFNSAGARLWGTYYGGNGIDGIHSCSTDASGNVYIAGSSTLSIGTQIATTGGHQSTIGGNYDAFLVKFNSSGVRQWGTYYGGIGWDSGSSCCTDASGNVYLAGYTSCSVGIVIATSNAHQTTFGGGPYDAFLVKFNTSGIRLWGTYYGGGGNDHGTACINDVTGNVYLGGLTDSNGGNIISTPGSHQSAYGGGSNGYLVKFNSLGVRQWGTYYGSVGSDFVYSCATDPAGNIYISGMTNNPNSGSVIATSGSHQTTFGGGTNMSDAYLAKFNSAGIRQWGTYYGGNGLEHGRDCLIDVFGNIYLGGVTTSSISSTIATAGAFQINYSGAGYDAFLVKFKNCDNINPVISVNTSICQGSIINLSSAITGTVIPIYNWSGPNSFTSNVQNPVITNASTIHVGIYSLTVNNSGCIETTTTQITTINQNPTITVSNGTICSGNSFTITPSGANTYTYSSGSAIVNPLATTVYTVNGSTVQNCNAIPKTLTVTVKQTPTIAVNNASICIGASTVLIASGASTYSWSNGSVTPSIVVNPISTTIYTVTGTSNNCSKTQTVSLFVSPCTNIFESKLIDLNVIVYPNPSSDKFTFSGLVRENTIEVYDVSGRLILNEHTTTDSYQINLNAYNNGIYFYKIKDKYNNTQQGKLLLQ
jgi:hypothetical protein